MNMKKTHMISISSLVGVAALVTFSMSLVQYIPYVHAEDYEKHLTEFKTVKGDVTSILIMQVESEILRLEDKVAAAEATREDKLRLKEKQRHLKKLEERDV